MKHRVHILLVLLVLFTGVAGPFPFQVQAQEPVVRAVLFYSPTCPHCETVINEVIPPLVDQYGTRLQIFGVNTATQDGSQLFSAAIEAYAIPPDRQAVPLLIVDERVLLGSNEIPQEFPTIIEEGMASGGIDWPEIPGLQEKMQQANNGSSPTQNTESEQVVHLEQEATLLERFRADLAGNLLTTLVLAGMIGTVFFVGSQLNRGSGQTRPELANWVILLLSALGMIIALYLSYVEITRVEAVCGPVGDCNTVQQSPYARLFGVIPVGLLGVVGYALIAGTWLASAYGPRPWRSPLKLGAWALSLVGTLFSIYLTFLEPFVIGASCMWCLTSAVIMTVLFVLLSRELTPGTETKGSAER